MIAEAKAFEGKYEILEKIREGGMGAVYKVRHRLLDEIRVIKVIRPHLSTSPGMGERFLREARLAIRVRHPNIAQFHDFSVDPDGTAYIVMEFIDGLTLADVLARTSPLPLGLALEVARGALAAIGYLHRRGMIHRDISPDNLMLGRNEDEEARVTLLDLGIAKSLAGSSSLTSSGEFLGKPRYASPEHFGASGLEGVGSRSDLYSFGIVLYELLTGICPVQGRDTSSWIAGHLFRPPLDFAASDPAGRVPSELREALLKVLAKAPEDRFASAEEMAAALESTRSRFPMRSEDLERALGALRSENPPAEPAAPGTTQERLDVRFAPVETPAPQAAVHGATMVLHPRDELAASEPARAPTRAEPKQARPIVKRLKSSQPARPIVKPLISIPVTVLLLGLALGIWWVVRSREASPRARTPSDPRPASEIPPAVLGRAPVVAAGTPSPPPEPIMPGPEASLTVPTPEVRARPIAKRETKRAIENEKHQEEVSPRETQPINEPSAEPLGRSEGKDLEEQTAGTVERRRSPYRSWLRRVFGEPRATTTDSEAPSQTDTPAPPELANPPIDRALRTVYTKEGSAIQVREYWVENAQVYMILPNGTKAYLAAKDVDFERTGISPPPR
jgi:serine/threonine-protein kinase